MALYEIHQDLIDMGKRLELECKTDSIKAVASKINSLLISLQKHNTIVLLASKHKLLIKKGKKLLRV